MTAVLGGATPVVRSISHQVPPRPILSLDELVGVRLIRHAQVSAVPDKRLLKKFFAELHSQGHVTEQDSLGERTGKLKI